MDKELEQTEERAPIGEGLCREDERIDDLQRNIDAAASLGIRTLHYAGDGRNERAEAFFGEYL